MPGWSRVYSIVPMGADIGSNESTVQGLTVSVKSIVAEVVNVLPLLSNYSIVLVMTTL